MECVWSWNSPPPSIHSHRWPTPFAAASGAPAGLAQPPLRGAGERPKGTTDTARRILATLESLDQAVAKGGAAAQGAGLGTPAAEQQQEEEQEDAAAAPPPPTESLGFAGGAVYWAGCHLGMLAWWTCDTLFLSSCMCIFAGALQL